MLKSKTTPSNLPWSEDLRVRVGEIYNHENRDWVNITGKNSEPSFNSLDWDVVDPFQELSAGRPNVIVFGNLFTLDKHPNNSNLEQLEQFDCILDGWRSDTEHWDKAQYIGGAQNSDSSYLIISRTKDLQTN